MTAPSTPLPARERLLIATLETIDEQGLARATTRQIAARAGANLQLIGYYFGGKDGLLQQAERLILTRYFALLRPAVLDADSLSQAIRRGIGLTWGLARTQPAMVQPDLLLQSVRAGRVDAGPDRPRLTRTLVADMLPDVMDRTGEGLSIPLGPFVLILTTGMGGLILDYRVTRDADAVGDAVARFADLLAEQVVPCEAARPSACSVLRPLTHEPRSAR